LADLQTLVTDAGEGQATAVARLVLTDFRCYETAASRSMRAASC